MTKDYYLGGDTQTWYTANSFGKMVFSWLEKKDK